MLVKSRQVIQETTNSIESKYHFNHNKILKSTDYWMWDMIITYFPTQSPLATSKIWRNKKFLSSLTFWFNYLFSKALEIQIQFMTSFVWKQFKLIASVWCVNFDRHRKHGTSDSVSKQEFCDTCNKVSHKLWIICSFDTKAPRGAMSFFCIMCVFLLWWEHCNKTKEFLVTTTN